MKRVLCTLMAALVLGCGSASAQEVSSEWETDGLTLWMKLPCMVSRNLDAQAWEFTSGNGVFIMRAMSDGAYMPGWGTPEAYAVFLETCGLPSNIPESRVPEWMKP